MDDVPQSKRKHLEPNTNWDEWCSNRETLQACVLRFQEMVQDFFDILQSPTDFVELGHLDTLYLANYRMRTTPIVILVLKLESLRARLHNLLA